MPFVCDVDGTQLVTFLGRFENLHNDFDTILERIQLGISSSLAHLNKSTDGEFRTQYAPHVVDNVAEMRSWDIACFGYTFE